ncbi:EpsG family protein [Facklamia sp. P9177]|uniref:EpsG family protein n=1 Tax=Facklamia sp. P9177 TaxID=3421945 RepID=UPI003D17B8D6
MLILFQFLLISVIFIILFFLSVNEYKFSLFLKKIILLVSILSISILASQRTIGTDLQTYYGWFLKTYPIDNFSLFIQDLGQLNIEPTYYILVSILKSLGGNFQIFLGLYAFIPLFIIYLIILKIEKDHIIKMFSIFLLIYLIRWPLDIIRQFAGMTFYLGALLLYVNKRYILASISSFLSIFSHFSAILTALTNIFLNKFSFKKTSFLILCLISLLFGFIFNLEFIFDFLNSTFDLALINKAELYLTSNYEYKNFIHFISRNLMEHFSPILNFLIIYLFLNKKNIYIYSNNSIYKVILNSMMFGSFLYFYLIGAGAFTFAYRLNSMYSIGNFIIITRLITEYIDRRKMNVYYLIYIILIIYNLIIVYYYTGAFNL